MVTAGVYWVVTGSYEWLWGAHTYRVVTFGNKWLGVVTGGYGVVMGGYKWLQVVMGGYGWFWDLGG